MDQAELECAKLNAKLPLPRNENENTDIFALSDALETSKFMIGANDLLVEGEWKDVNDSLLNYFNWDSGAPNNYANSQHWVNFVDSGKWNDESKSKIRNVVCEREPIGKLK